MGCQVLIVDDSTTVRSQVRHTLLAAGFEVLEAADGVEGLDVLRANAAIGVVVCDVNMPQMNGIEMLERMKADGIGTPVVMLTTEGQPALIRRARTAGARGWMVKPFKPDLLVQAVNRLMEAGHVV